MIFSRLTVKELGDPFISNISIRDVGIIYQANVETGFRVRVNLPALDCNGDVIGDCVALCTDEPLRDHEEFWRVVRRIRESDKKHPRRAGVAESE